MLKRLLLLLFTLTLTFGFIACDDDDGGDIVGPGDTTNPTFTSNNIKDGSVYFNFRDASYVQVDDDVFDLKFKEISRSPEFFLNDNVQIYEAGTDFDAVTSVDTGMYTDDPDTSITGGNWYNYDFMTHTLSTKGIVYVIKTTRDTHAKMRIDDYDNGVFMIRYALYDGTTFGATHQAEVGLVNDEGHFAFVDVPSQWDIKMGIILLWVEDGGFAGYMNLPGIMLNDGVGVVTITDQTFEEVDPTTLPESAFQTDTATEYVIGDTWFEYDGETHIVTSRGYTYAVKLADGSRAKFRVLTYYNEETNESGYMKIEYVLAS
ncbi:MAG: hypothetical protein D6675_07165 [Gemmatimonadetes bacterium]|nr:MAG: hypothetical protein D6675_07165 [Gemmatimonadota bacterium]